jgi:transketolase N-terminal domain/subunit
MSPLEKRAIDISYRLKKTHVSSVLNTIPLLEEIYDARDREDPVVLGNSHASLALFVVLEKHGYCDAEEMVKRHGTHANRDMEHGVWVSGGSLGQAETVAAGLALADPSKCVWLVTSDGALAEGAVAETIRLSRQLGNLFIHVVWNGLGAYGPSDEQWWQAMKLSNPRIHRHIVDQGRYPKWLRGLNGHYATMTEAQHAELMQ